VNNITKEAGKKVKEKKKQFAKKKPFYFTSRAQSVGRSLPLLLIYW